MAVFQLTNSLNKLGVLLCSAEELATAGQGDAEDWNRDYSGNPLPIALPLIAEARRDLALIAESANPVEGMAKLEALLHAAYFLTDMANMDNMGSDLIEATAHVKSAYVEASNAHAALNANAKPKTGRRRRALQLA